MHPLLQTVPLIAGMALCMACSDDPDPITLVSGDYYGRQTFGTATCSPIVPPGFDVAGWSSSSLLTVSQSGAEVSAADRASTVVFTGTFNTSGEGILVTTFQNQVDDSTLVVCRDSLAVAIQGNSDRLTATGQWVTTGQGVPGGQTIATCTRSRSWNLTRRSEAVPELPKLDCSQEATLRPQGSLSSQLIIFTNNTASAVDIFSISTSGSRIFHAHLNAGERIGLEAAFTAPSQALVVADPLGQCLGIYRSIEGPSLVTLAD